MTAETALKLCWLGAAIVQAYCATRSWIVWQRTKRMVALLKEEDRIWKQARH